MLLRFLGGGRLPGVRLFAGEVAVGEGSHQVFADCAGRPVLAGGIHGDEDARIVVGVDLKHRVEELGVAAVPDDAVAVAAEIPIDQAHVVALGEGPEGFGVGGLRLHLLPRAVLHQRAAL